jgi:restriction endonuclease S subunit
LESCALVTDEYNNALCSTGFYVINSKKINSETLLVLFKSEPIQNILKQSCSGTILTAINKNEFQKIPVPLIDKAIQELIKTKLTESFQLKKQSNTIIRNSQTRCGNCHRAKRRSRAAVYRTSPTGFNMNSRR